MVPMQALFQPLLKVESIVADASVPRFRVKAVSSNFIANMLGMGAKSSITMDENGFRLNKSSFASQEQTFIPKAQIAATVLIVQKPVELLVLGLLTLAAFGLGLLFIIIYFFARRRAIIGVLSMGGTLDSLKLKASDADLEELQEGMAIMEDLVRNRAPQASGGRQLSERSEAPPADTGQHILTCPHCNARMKSPTSMAGRKIRCSSCREPFTVSAEE